MAPIVGVRSCVSTIQQFANVEKQDLTPMVGDNSFGAHVSHY